VTARRTAIALAALSAALCAGALLSLVLSWDAPIGEGTWGFRGFGLINGIGFTTIGAIVALRRPSSVIGWLLLASGLVWSIVVAESEYAVYAVAGRPTPLPGGVLVAWLGSWEWTTVVGVYPVLLVLLPDGRLSTPVRRAVVAGSVLVTALLAFQFAFRPGPLQLAAFIDNPFTPLPRTVINAVGAAALALTAPLAIAAAAALVGRFRRSVGIERQQLKWLAYAALPVVAFGPLSGVVPGKPIQLLGALSQVGVPVAIGIAILRYRLYDIDVLINRTLVYAATTAGIAVTFFAGVVVLQALLRPITSGSEVAVAISTLASVALFQPLRGRVQRAVDLRFYRSRYNAARTLDAFSVRLRDQVALEAVRDDLLEAVRDTVQPAHSSLWLRAE
jgi:hypothetical protein